MVGLTFSIWDKNISPQLAEKSQDSACPNKRWVASGTTVISATSNEVKGEIINEVYSFTVSKE